MQLLHVARLQCSSLTKQALRTLSVTLQRHLLQHKTQAHLLQRNRTSLQRPILTLTTQSSLQQFVMQLQGRNMEVIEPERLASAATVLYGSHTTSFQA